VQAVRQYRSHQTPVGSQHRPQQSGIIFTGLRLLLWFARRLRYARFVLWRIARSACGLLLQTEGLVDRALLFDGIIDANCRKNRCGMMII